MRFSLSVIAALIAVCQCATAEPRFISLADSPFPGLRERVETHLVQEYDCVVISRGRASAAQFERSVDQMTAISAPALPSEAVPAADCCVWVNAWNNGQYQEVPAAGMREIAWSVTDLQQQPARTNRIARELVPERSDYERELADRVAATLRLAAKPGNIPASPKTLTLAVLPFVQRTASSRVFYDHTLPPEQSYLHAEAALPECLPKGASILSRDRIRQVLAEHNLSALAESGTGLRSVAYLLPADALVCGTVSYHAVCPNEIRLDLHLVDTRSSAFLAAWQGTCTDKEDLPNLADQGMRALMVMPWRAVTPRDSSVASRRRESEFMLGYFCYSEAWSLARDIPDLYARILSGVLRQAEVYCYSDVSDASSNTYERQMLREAALTVDDAIGSRTYLESEKERVPWPGLIRAEIHFWLGEFAEAERLCRAHMTEHPQELTARAKLILAWTLFGQKRIAESRSLFNDVVAEKGLMWYFRRLGGGTGWYWANSLSIKLANASGDDKTLYEQVRQKMGNRKLIYEPEMQAYLREVDRQQPPEQVVRELSSVLLYDAGSSLLPELVAQRPMALSYHGWFTHLSPAYVVRGRCHEKLGNSQQAAEDYALYLRICHFPFTADNQLSGDAKAKSGYEAEAIDGLDRLRKCGVRPCQPWLTPAESRTFPVGLRIYVVPVGLYDRATVDQFVANTALFLGAPVTLLPEVAMPRLTPQESKKGARFYDAQALCAAVLKGLEVPDDVVQLVLATSEDFRFPAKDDVQKMGSPDEGATILLSVKDSKSTFPEHLKRVIPRTLHYRYAAPVSERYKQLDPAITVTFLRTWDHCSKPCLFSEEAAPRFQTADTLSLLCPRCVEKYRKADLSILQKKAVAALKKQGVKIIPSADMKAAPKASAGH